MNDLKFSVTPLSEKFDRHDPRWLAQKEELTRELKRGATDVRKEVVPVEGMKGGLETLIVAIGGSQIIPGIIELIKTWISRDKTRKVQVTVERNGDPVKITLDSTGIDKKMLKEVLETALEQQQE